ncbi:MAG: thioredoxin domain-containing protein [Candidatus Puniceispirillaceae bacterium]
MDQRCDDKQNQMTDQSAFSRRDMLLAGSGMVAASILPSFAQAKANQDIDHILAPRYLGDENAPVQVAEYFSMTCGHCAAFHQNTFDKVKSNLIDTGKVRFEMRPFPLDAIALRAHALARILPVNLYYPMISQLLKKPQDWKKASDPIASLGVYAKQAGVSSAEFDEMLRNRALLEAVVSFRQSGARKYGVQSTPSFVINDDKLLSGNMSYEEMLNQLNPFGI